LEREESPESRTPFGTPKRKRGKEGEEGDRASSRTLKKVSPPKGGKESNAISGKRSSSLRRKAHSTRERIEGCARVGQKTRKGEKMLSGEKRTSSLSKKQKVGVKGGEGETRPETRLYRQKDAA